MSHARIAGAALALALGCMGAAQDAPQEGILLSVDIQGSHQGPWGGGGGGGGQGFPFALQGDARLPFDVLNKLIPSGKDTGKSSDVSSDVAAELFACFQKGIKDNKNGGEVNKVSGKLSVKIKEQSKTRVVLSVSGEMKLEWSPQENAMWVASSELAATITYQGNKAAGFELECKKSSTGGSWEFGGNRVPLRGTVSVFSVKTKKESKEGKRPKK